MIPNLKSTWSAAGIVLGRPFLLLLMGVALGSCRKETLDWTIKACTGAMHQRIKAWFTVVCL
ncbi:MAG: hypothetical protein ACKOAV_02820, partial [Bacteroidota bacterium]